jgi:ADP-ribose pyrophosphatase YjhB (NUDIX family)
VASVVTHKDGRILLIKEQLQKNDVPLWNIVKGSYHGGETVFEAAIRECKEETSLDVRLVGSLGTYVAEADGKMRIQFTFIAQPTATSGEAHIADAATQEGLGETISEIRWFSKEELQKLGPSDFVSLRAYAVLQDWLKGTRYPLESVVHVEM